MSHSNKTKRMNKKRKKIILEKRKKNIKMMAACNSEIN